MVVASRFYGEFVHRLEYESDVFIVSRGRSAIPFCYRVRLRSDIFPSAWDGQDVGVVFDDREPGVAIWQLGPQNYIVRKEGIRTWIRLG